MKFFNASALLMGLAIVISLSSYVYGEQPLDLGLAEPYAILASTAVSSTLSPGTEITGNIGISPGAAYSGFPPAVLNGVASIANPAAASAQASLSTAYNVLVNKSPFTVLTGQDLGTMTLPPGVYRFAAGAGLTGVLTLDAATDGANAIWVFQI
eukprot:gene28813-32541_t